MATVRTLKLGTRKSLLAWAQSSWVASEVERLNPGVKVDLVGIETAGDKILDIPLSKVEGKEFFVAEIDQALLSEKVDFTVHSLKDLSLQRSEGLLCAAIPRRENPRDVVIFGPQALERLKRGHPLKIGTSSPRRLENIPSFLKKALPTLNRSDRSTDMAPDAGPDLDFVEIRGNVNTRLSRIHEPIESPRYLDGVVLAFAGLIRLWADSSGQVELLQLLKGARWMVLPLKECPAAPGQGALAVECRASDGRSYEILRKLHDFETTENIGLERQLLKKFGGGCHQRFGATAENHEILGRLFFVKGKVSKQGQSNSDMNLEDFQWNRPEFSFRADLPSSKLNSWNGNEWRRRGEKALPGFSVNKREINQVPKFSSAFIAHPRAVQETEILEAVKGQRVWTSGVSSWFHLAKQGVWVEGCAEGLGFDFLTSTLQEGVLGLPSLDKWLVLTHQDAVRDWENRNMTAIGAYQVQSVFDQGAKSALVAATHVFWSSGSQWNELKEWVPDQAIHACGPGKTAARLRQAGMDPLIFPNVEEWKKWLKNGNIKMTPNPK